MYLLIINHEQSKTFTREIDGEYGSIRFKISTVAILLMASNR